MESVESLYLTQEWLSWPTSNFDIHTNWTWKELKTEGAVGYCISFTCWAQTLLPIKINCWASTLLKDLLCWTKESIQPFKAEFTVQDRPKHSQIYYTTHNYALLYLEQRCGQNSVAEWATAFQTQIFCLQMFSFLFHICQISCYFYSFTVCEVAYIIVHEVFSLFLSNCNSNKT